MLTKKDIKMIAIDMDGTLLNNEHEISTENRQAIKEAEERGVHVVISTGRTRMTSDDLVKSLSLNSYTINVNGSEIWDESGQLVERTLLATEFIEKMWELKQKYDTYCWGATVGNVWRKGIPEDLTAHEWMKFGFDIPDNEIREIIFKELSSIEALEVSNSSPTNLEINAKGVNKAKALEKVCKLLGITMDNVMALGDSLNDLAMIKEAGLGVAMGNAQEDVKAAADAITKSNVEDGVAHAIRKYVLS